MGSRNLDEILEKYKRVHLEAVVLKLVESVTLSNDSKIS
jgi:hypothetical protein